MDDEPNRSGGPAGDSGDGEWDAASSAWATEADRLDEDLAPVTAAMLEGAGLTPGQRVLELACGPGGAGLAAAVAVGPDGAVLCTDNSDKMLATAARRAEARGLGNVTTRAADLDDLGALDDRFDAVICRFGLMFAGDPAATTREIVRLLRPGGRLAAAVFDDRERNPWLSIVFEAVGDELGVTVPPPGVAGPFSLNGDAARAALAGGGLADVTIEPVDLSRSWPSIDVWFAETAALAGPVAAVLSSLDPSIQRNVVDRARAAAADYAHGSAVDFPGRVIVATGRAPST